MKTILLIDDDPQVRKIFGLTLRRYGYHVLEADCGVAGFEIARQFLPDLILSDINMPGGDGSTLLHNIRRDSELRSRQVVLMTGKSNVITPRQGMEEGADDFLIKPIGLQELLNCMKARFDRASINWRVADQTLAQLSFSLPSQLPHEFFTPLAGIIGLMDILCCDDSTLTPKEVGDIHRDVHQSALRLHRTLRNYLHLLDLQTASSETAPGSLPPGEVEKGIQNGVTEALRQHARREDLTVKVTACPILAKRGDLDRIVEELVDNACKFSRQGTPVKLDLTAEGRMTVVDGGRGLTAEEISRIGAFQQFDRKKYEQQGLGLGLVLVQKLTALYGANFQINSRPGEGTQVEIMFPRMKRT